MRTLAVLATAAVSLAACVAGSAGTASATRLVLQRSDVPAGAKRVSFGSSAGAIKIPRTVRGQAAYSAYRFRNGRSRELVGSAAGIVRNAVDAHAVFKKLRRDLTKRSTLRRLRLPRYGSEQVAIGISLAAASAGVLLVRTGSRLWEVAVSAAPGLGAAKARAELEKYAAKERRRAAT